MKVFYHAPNFQQALNAPFFDLFLLSLVSVLGVLLSPTRDAYTFVVNCMGPLFFPPLISLTPFVIFYPSSGFEVDKHLPCHVSNVN